jgi:3-oxoacyl-[acyl-carrier protein] reductase
MINSLENKLALITGASRGIGAGIARRLAEHGAAVLVHYGTNHASAESVVNSIKKAGGEAEVVGADLADRDGPRSLLEKVDSAFKGRFDGRIDVLVNNAGTAEVSFLTDATDEAFDRLFNLNVRAPFQLSRAAAQRMIKSGWGRIINIGSIFGEAVPISGVGIYASTKFAVAGFTRAWSRDLGKTGVTVNSVQPGPIDTDLNPDDDGPLSTAMKELTSLGRYGKTEEVAVLVAFLASPQSAFINGATMTVDGGCNA